MNQSDDDNAFEKVGSEDLHTDKDDHTDSESFEIIGSEELNSVVKDMEELDHAGSISEGNDIGILSMKSGDSSQSYKGKRHGDVVYDMDGTAYVLRPNIKLIKKMEIKDVAKDHIIPFLPAKSLMRFKAVSKDWDDSISHPFFAHTQTLCFRDMSGFFCQDNFNQFFVSLDQAAYGIPDSSLSFLPSMVKIRSSCNGLLLCQGVGDEDSVNEYYICNPANKGFHVLPRSTYYHGPEPNLILAFEPSLLNCGEDYKVICAFDIYNGPPMLCFDIYSSETRSWTCCNSVCSELGAPYLKDNGLYKNGVAYWATSSGELLAFDTVSDICGLQPICSDVKGGGILTLIDGELSYVQSYIKPSYFQTGMQTGILGDETVTGFFGDDKATGNFGDETGAVKNKCVIEIFGGVDMRLKRRDIVRLNMKIHNTWSFRVLFAVKSNHFIFNIDDVLYSCDVKKEKLEVISGGWFKPTATYIPYVNSLVSLP